MTGSLRGVQSKFERALEQRSAMQAIVKEFAESDFYEIATERDYRGRIVGRAVNVKTPGRRGARQKMRGLSPQAKRTLERLQPYHRSHCLPELAQRCSSS